MADDFDLGEGGKPSVASAPVSMVKRKVGGGVVFTDEAMKEWLFGKQAGKQPSFICCGIYGGDGTNKTGMVMGCRSAQEVKDGKKLVFFDLDGGCAPLKLLYHDDDPNIIVKNPIVRDEEMKIDYETTFTKMKSAANYIETHLQELNIKAVCLDGLDSFLKNCELSMKEELGLTPGDAPNRRYWNNRNTKYYDVVEQLKFLGCDVYFITHMKMDDATKMMIPSWHDKTPDKLFQKIECMQVTTNDPTTGKKVVSMKAIIRKCKGNLALEGREYETARIEHTKEGTKAVWRGLQLRAKDIVDANDEKKKTIVVWQKNDKGKEVEVV